MLTPTKHAILRWNQRAFRVLRNPGALALACATARHYVTWANGISVYRSLGMWLIVRDDWVITCWSSAEPMPTPHDVDGDLEEADTGLL